MRCEKKVDLKYIDALKSLSKLLQLFLLISYWGWNKDNKSNGKFNRLSNDIYVYDVIFDIKRISGKWNFNIEKSLVYPEDNCLAVLNTDFDYGLFRLPDLDYWLTVGVTSQQGMLIPPRHLFLPLVYPYLPCTHFRIFVILLLLFVWFFLLLNWLHFAIFYFSSLPTFNAIRC